MTTTNMKTVQVELGEDSYPIYIGADTLGSFGEYFVMHCGKRRAIIITDTNVGPIYVETVQKSLAAQDVESHVITVPAGEATKRMEVVESIYDQLFEFSVERNDAIVALGGGVVGDLAGFVAATFKRGVKFVQLPTSLLAMVDSSVGGKTGINHPRGKNMIGAFYQPKLVFADIAVLSTLPKRELGCGLAETVKHSIIRDTVFFDLLNERAEDILNLDQQLMVNLVERNCQIKASVVSEDEKESGLRGILNYGHTVGHTFETVLYDQDYHHGEAVSLGMVSAGRLAVQRDMISQDTMDRCIALQEKLHLPVSVDGSLPIDDMYQAMKQDKKVSAGKIKFVLATGIGSCEFVSDLTEKEICAAIESLVK